MKRRWAAQAVAVVAVAFPPLVAAADVELVQRPDVRITATTPSSSISVLSGQGYERTYEWNGCSFTLNLSPRDSRWYGSLGIRASLAGAGFLSDLLPAAFTCKGIDRPIVEEAQLHFTAQKEAEQWLARYSRHFDTVWTSDGLVVQWLVSPSRRQLNVDVYQLCVADRKPTALLGARDDQVQVERVRGSEPMRHECVPVGRAVQLQSQKLWRAHWEQADFMNSSAPFRRGASGPPVSPRTDGQP